MTEWLHLDNQLTHLYKKKKKKLTLQKQKKKNERKSFSLIRKERPSSLYFLNLALGRYLSLWIVQLLPEWNWFCFSAWELANGQDIECLGVFYGLVGRVKYNKVDRFILIRDSVLVGTVPLGNEVYKIKSIVLLNPNTEVSSTAYNSWVFSTFFVYFIFFGDLYRVFENSEFKITRNQKTCTYFFILKQKFFL